MDEQRNPDHFELRDAYSELLIELKDVQTASIQLQALADANPKNVTVLTDLGFVLREIGEIENARKHYGTALKINDEYPGAHNNLGFLLLHDTREYEEAHFHLMKAIKYDPGFPNPYRHLGDLYRIDSPKQDFAASKLFYHKALELREDYMEAIHGLKVIALMERKIIEKERKVINQLNIEEELLIPYQPYLDGIDLIKGGLLQKLDSPDSAQEAV